MQSYVKLPLAGRAFLVGGLLAGLLPVEASAQEPAGPSLRVEARPTSVTGEQAAGWSGFDDATLTGPFTLRFEVQKHDGRSAVGKKWVLAAGGLMPDDPPRRTVAEGEVPESGSVEVAGLGGIAQRISAEELKRQRRFAPWYSVWVDERMVGQVSFFEWAKLGPDHKPSEFAPHSSGQTVQEREYKLPPEVGDQAPDVALTELVTSDPVRLSHFRGQLVLLEFWSSKCHSCENVMMKNHEVLARRGKDWEGKVVFLAASIDKDPDLAADCVKRHGWTGMIQTWSGEGGTGRYSRAAEAYVITGTPAGVLIGPEGTIRWCGSPHQLNLEETVDRYLKALDKQTAKAQ